LACSARRRREPHPSAREGSLTRDMAESPRRFPGPWRADKVPGGYVVRDATGQAIAYLYGRETEAEARSAVSFRHPLGLVSQSSLQWLGGARTSIERQSANAE
jgi:hypothetical protein